MRKRFYVLTGGTLVHVAPHFSLCAPAYGRVGEDIHARLSAQLGDRHEVVLVRTKMARGSQRASEAELELFEQAKIRQLESNDELARLLELLAARADTGCVVLACAVCDWQPSSLGHSADPQADQAEPLAFGKARARLDSRGGELQLGLRAADKLIGGLRSERKDIFLVGFKATTGESEDAQYIRGLRLLKGASCNLVLANDLHTRVNMVITPEEARYHVTQDRAQAIAGLCEIIELRSGLHYTRSTVVPGQAIAWDAEVIPESLRAVVNHCIARGAYKPFMGKTVGHFATRGPRAGVIYTSRRKSNFNHLAEQGLLEIEAVDDERVIARGAKPSVGGQSQRLIFDAHADVDCIVHFHCPMKPASSPAQVPVRAQRPFECGSLECGQNTSEGLREILPGIKAVFLDEHGPNVCFAKHEDPQRVIEFIERNFDLDAKTGGPVELATT